MEYSTPYQQLKRKADFVYISCIHKIPHHRLGGQLTGFLLPPSMGIWSGDFFVHWIWEYYGNRYIDNHQHHKSAAAGIFQIDGGWIFLRLLRPVESGNLIRMCRVLLWNRTGGTTDSTFVNIACYYMPIFTSKYEKKQYKIRSVQNEPVCLSISESAGYFVWKMVQRIYWHWKLIFSMALFHFSWYIQKTSIPNQYHTINLRS